MSTGKHVPVDKVIGLAQTFDRAADDEEVAREDDPTHLHNGAAIAYRNAADIAWELVGGRPAAAKHAKRDWTIDELVDALRFAGLDARKRSETTVDVVHTPIHHDVDWLNKYEMKGANPWPCTLSDAMSVVLERERSHVYCGCMGAQRRLWRFMLEQEAKAKEGA